MRRGRCWISSQWDYVLGRATDLGRWFRHVSVRKCLFVITPTITLLLLKLVQGGEGDEEVPKGTLLFPSLDPRGGGCAELVSKYEELCLDVIPPSREGAPHQPMDVG